MRKDNFDDEGLATAVISVLALVSGRLADYSSTLCTWVSDGGFVGQTFTKHALPNVWDFAEVNPISDGGGSFESAMGWVLRVIEANNAADYLSGVVIQADARIASLPQGAADLACTDPPYYAEIPYADISDFFYVWLRKSMQSIDPQLFSSLQVNRENEIIVTNSCQDIKKDAHYFEEGISSAASALVLSTKPTGLLVFVFANAKTAAWEAMLQALINAGLSVVASWPIETERAARSRAQRSASLLSSVHIVCRPRSAISSGVDFNSVGDWRTVLSELPHRIKEWMPRLRGEGVVGADAIFACLGPALEVFSRYSRVEKASGEVVELKEYLVQVWAAVAQEALAQVFKGADATGFESDARLTAMWLWTLKAPEANGNPDESEDDEDDSSEEQEGNKTKAGGFKMAYDAARKIAQGLGANLESLPHLVEVKGNQARLLPVVERTKHLFGKDEEEPARAAGRKKSVAQLDLFAALTGSEDAEIAWKEKTVKRLGETALDRVHQAMILFAAGRGEALKRFVVEDGVGQDGKFWRLAQALSALYPSGTDEKRWVDGVLARKKQFGF
jgi:adenine-specific DNA methylase